MTYPNRFRFLLLACVILALPGCELRDTREFYHPVAHSVYPAKPSHCEVKIWDRPPAGHYKVIGRYTCRKSFEQQPNGVNGQPRTLQDGWDWMDNALKYNARRAGADNVIVFDRDVNTTTLFGEGPGGRACWTYLIDAEMIVFE